jgi:ankyrin repeat protein
MKKVKTYNIFLNESLRDKLKGKSEEEIIQKLKGLSTEELLLRACKFGMLSLVKIIIEEENYDPSTMKYNTCIDDAAINGHFDVVKYLLDDGRFDPSEYEFGTITMASENGHLEMVKLLLKDHRVDPTEEYNNPIGIASQNGHLEVVKELMKDKRVDPSDSDNYPISIASQNGHLEVVKELLKDKRVDPKVGFKHAVDNLRTKVANYLEDYINGNISESLRDKLKGKPFDEILQKFIKKHPIYSEIFYSLFPDKQFDIDVEYGSPFSQFMFTDKDDGGNDHKFLIRQGRHNVYPTMSYFKKLAVDDDIISSTINIGNVKSIDDVKKEIEDTKNSYGKMKIEGYNESLKGKIKGKTDEELINAYNDNPYEMLRKFMNINYIHGILYAIDKGIDIDKDGEMLLMNSCSRGHLNILKVLVDKGFDLTKIETSNAFAGPLGNASKNGHLDIVKFLLEQGYDINGDNGCAIASSIANGHYDIFKYLIDKGASLDIKHQDILKYAIDSGNFDIVSYLLGNGFNIPDDKKYEYFENVAIHSRNPKLVKYIFDKAKIKIKNNQILFDSIKYNGEFEIIKLLHDNKPEHPNKKIYGSNRTLNYIKNMSIGDISQSAVLTNNLEGIKHLIEKKDGIEYLDDVVLRWSSYMGYSDIVMYLFNNKLIDGEYDLKQGIKLAKLNNQNKIVNILNKYIK